MRIVEAMAETLRQEMHRGRGGDAVFPFPVDLEPPFTPFRHSNTHAQRGKPAKPLQMTKAETAPLRDLKVLKVRLSPQDAYDLRLSEQQLLAFSSHRPVAFEVVGHGGSVWFQFVAAKEDAPNLVGQLHSHYPGAEVFEDADLLQREDAPRLLARSYRLRESHLFQIRVEQRPESLTALVGILAGLKEREVGLLQVLFQPARHPWYDNILEVAGDPWDPAKSAFSDLPDLPRKARNKVERPLFAVAVRLAASSKVVLERLEGSFLSQLDSGENGFVDAGREYPPEPVMERFTRTPGMLLNVRELSSLVHLPDPDAVSEGLEVANAGAPAPQLATKDILAPLGWNEYRGQKTPVGISAEHLTRHVAIFGGTGSGKTNLMKVAFGPLLARGYGAAVVDFKGDLAQGILDLVPEHRIEDVVWFDPTDREHPPALNVLEASAGHSSESLTSELMVGLKRLFHGSSEFGPRMEWILRNAVRTLLDSEGEKTLYDIPRFLEDEKFRREVLTTVRDRELREFWGRRNLSPTVVDPVLNRLSSFLDRTTIRNIVAQPNRIDFHRMMRENKIFIANLEAGVLQDASFVLGSFILSRLQLAALARRTDERNLYPIIVDEFHNIAGHGMDTTSIETFVTTTRSYWVPLVMATQYVGRLSRDVAAAIFSPVGTLVCMQVGQIDAQLLQREMGEFTAEDLMDLGIGEAIVRMGPAKDSFNVRVPLAQPTASWRKEIIKLSQERYCRTRAEVEELLERRTEPEPSKEQPSRSWIVDAQGNVFTTDQLQEYLSTAARKSPEQGRQEPAQKPLEPVRERVAWETGKEPQPATAPETQVDRELMEYLEHIARHPFIPALQRDELLKLSRYKGGLLRQRLTELGWIKQHRANTGRRSGQITLLEVLEAGYEFLTSMKIRVRRPPGRGGFLHRYYAHKLKEYAEATWKGCNARIEDSSRGRPADVTVRIPGRPERTVALEIFMTGEAKEIRGIARDIEIFDQVIVCAASPGALEALQSRARETLGERLLQKVDFHLISQYLLPEDSTEESDSGVADAPATSPSQGQTNLGKTGDQKLKSESEIEKSRVKSETGIEDGPPSGRRPGPRPRTPLMDQVEEAYAHIHDLDWLQNCELVNLPAVQERMDPRHIMPEAQALRGLLLGIGRQVIQELATVPDTSGVRVFLERHLEGKNLTEIARELGVSREWVRKRYRPEAFRLAGVQFVRVVSIES